MSVIVLLSHAVRLEHAAARSDTACRRADLTYAAKLLRERAGQGRSVIAASQRHNCPAKKREANHER